MRILCVSDSHGDLGTLLDLLEARLGTFDLLVHLGDGNGELDGVSSVYPTLEYAAVRGNCDRDGGFPTQQVLFYQGVKLFLTHGHLYGVKRSLELLRRTGLQEQAGLVLFGHTHIPYGKEEDGLLLFNPGALSPRAGGGSYGMLTLENGQITHWGHFLLDGTPLSQTCR